MQFIQPLLAVGLLMSTASFKANAELTKYLGAGNVGLVYNSVLDVTWTSDANLLGTMEAKAIAGGDTSAQNLITSIINASGGGIYDIRSGYNGIYTLSASDFTTTDNGQGRATWWGQQAFVHYLNTIDYGNSNQWALPTLQYQDTGYNITYSQMGELFYNELGGTAGNPIPSNPNFINGQAYAYWFGNEYTDFTIYAWAFHTINGYQNVNPKGSLYYAWAVSPGQIAAVPVPGAVWLMGSGLLGLLGLKQRGRRAR